MLGKTRLYCFIGFAFLFHLFTNVTLFSCLSLLLFFSCNSCNRYRKQTRSQTLNGQNFSFVVIFMLGKHLICLQWFCIFISFQHNSYTVQFFCVSFQVTTATDTEGRGAKFIRKVLYSVGVYFYTEENACIYFV